MKFGRRKIDPGLVVIAVILNVMPAVLKVLVRIFGEIRRGASEEVSDEPRREAAGEQMRGLRGCLQQALRR